MKKCLFCLILPPLDPRGSAGGGQYTDQPKKINSIFKDTYHSNKSKDSNDNAAKKYEEIMRKLNYLVHLLEEQQDHKTGHVAEEVILYSFLGIFIIFVVDSFARAGKYVR